MAWNEPGGNKDPWSRKPKGSSEVDKLINEFSKSFKKANTVILCPIYKAGENIKLGFSYNSFAKKNNKKFKSKINTNK